MFGRAARVMFVTLMTATVIALGCQSEWRCPKTHMTPSGIPVAIRADVTEADRPTIDAWIDLRLEEWIRNKSAWGCETFRDEELRFAASREPVIVYAGYFLADPPGAMGFNWWKDGHAAHIDVTVNWPPMILDSYLYNGAGVGMNQFDYSYGFRQLPHEWTHSVRGNWHP